MPHLWARFGRTRSFPHNISPLLAYTYGELSPEYIYSVQKAPETHAALIHLL